MEDVETTNQAAETPPPLRVWPGAVACLLLLLSRFGVKAIVPGFTGFMWAIEGSFACAIAILVWWLFFSRAAWRDRVAGIFLIIAALVLTWLLRHESMGPAWMAAYATPFTLVAFVAAAFAARTLPVASRRLVMAASILLSAFGWTLVRTEGIDGDHKASFAWRFTETTEQRLLTKPIPTAAAPPLTPVPASAPPATAGAIVELSPVVTPEWPGFRGPNRDSMVPDVRISTDWVKSPPVEVWRKPVGPGWSSFAVQGDVLYTQEQRGEEELVVAYNARNGEFVWRHSDPVRFFESNAGAGPRATPTLAGGRVYSLGATGILNALDAATGRLVWRRATTADTKRPVPDWGFSASPVVAGELVIVYAGRLAAYEAATGELKWLGDSVGGSYSSPHLATIDGVKQLLILTPHGAAGLDPSTGSVLWSHDWKGLPIIQPALIPGGGILISASQSDGTRRIDPTRGAGGWAIETRWTSLALKPYFNDTVIHKGHAFGFDARILTCIDLNTGARLWKGGRYGNGQMLLLPDQELLLILSEDGEIALVQASPAGFTEMARIPALEGKTWNHPVIAKGLLFVRNAQEMAAFRLPAVGR